MTHPEPDICLKMPLALVEKLDAIARQKYINRNDVILDACVYYCQYHDMNNETRPETMRNVLFDLARHDGEFRQTLRDVLRERPGENSEKK